MPAGTNKVIGSTADEKLGIICFYIYNSNDDHSIYQWEAETDSSYKVYTDSVLDFSENGFVTGNIVESNTGDVLLYFTDGESDPKKINVTKALAATYSDKFTNGTDEEKLLFITVNKQPPLKAPSFNIVNNSNLGFNKIGDRYFQFAYKYIYDDGEHSVLSPYSSVAVSVAQLRDGFNTQEGKDFYNQINVFCRHTVADAKEIVLYARNGNEGAFHEVGRKANNHTSNAVTFNFTNDVIGAPISKDYQDKMYDNVPLKADSQEVIGGRLMYGGYTEGYANVDTTSSLIANYKKGGESLDIGLTHSSNYGLNLDYSNLPSTFTEDRTLYFNVMFDADEVDLFDSGGSNLTGFSATIKFEDEDGDNYNVNTITHVKDGMTLGISPLVVRERINVSSGDTIQDLKDAVAALFDAKRYTVNVFPLANGDSLKILKSGGTTLFTAETGDFVGTLTFRASCPVGTSLIFNVDKLDVKINTFIKAGRKRRVISGGRIYLDNQDSGTSFARTFDTIKQYHTASMLEPDDVVKTFKSGSDHKLGIVYYDDRNRSTGVQELGDVYVESFNNRSDENDLIGASSIVMRLSHNPPSFAKRWAPVYVGKGGTKSKFIFGVGGAFVPYNNDNLGITRTPTNRILLSLNTLFEKESSYTKAFNAEIEYGYEPGDMLRIIQYGSSKSRTTKTFRVVDDVTLTKDRSDNFILDNNAEDLEDMTTGRFLVIEENVTATGFTVEDIEDNDSNWFDRCIVEVYNEKQEVLNPIYYEIGTSYGISSGAHEDDRTATTLDLTITSSSSGDLEGNTATRIFKGDSIVVGSNTITIGNVYKEGSTYYFFATDKSATPLSVAAYTDATVSGSEKVIEITQGDAYFRPRVAYAAVQQKKYGVRRKPASTGGIALYIDDYSVTDFAKSEVSSIGRPHMYMPDAEQIKRKASITYSDFYSASTSILQLSSFNLSLANFKDLNVEHGSVKSLIGYGQTLYYIQERRCGVIPVGRNIIKSAGQQELITLDRNVLGAEKYYSGEYGCNNDPETVAHYNGNVFFCDVAKGAVISLGANGLNRISDKHMSSYFSNQFRSLANRSSYKIIAGIDKDNEEYIIHVPAISGVIPNITIGYAIDKGVWTSFYSYQPEGIISLRNQLHTFKDGELYIHQESSSKNGWYGAGTQASVVEVVANASPSSIKTFEAISTESDSKWSAVVSTTSQSASIASSSFKEKEGIYYAYIHGATTDRSSITNITSTSSTSEFFALGPVASSGVSGADVTFKTDVSAVTFPFGSDLYKLNQTLNRLEKLNVTAVSYVDRNTIKFSGNVTGVVENDVLVVVADSAIEGDQIRDYFAKIKLTKTSSVSTELYAINAVVADSKMHH